jgi:hypothetical protein
MADLSAEARSAKADVAQLAERVLGKDEVSSSILDIGSNLRSLRELRLASQAKVVHHSAKRDGGPRRSLRELRLGKPSYFAPERTAKADSYLSRRSAQREGGRSARPATGRAEAHKREGG